MEGEHDRQRECDHINDRCNTLGKLTTRRRVLAGTQRLSDLTRDKLLKIPAFAWAYRNYQRAKAWLEATEAWQIIRMIGRSVLAVNFQEVVHSAPTVNAEVAKPL